MPLLTTSFLLAVLPTSLAVAGLQPHLSPLGPTTVPLGCVRGSCQSGYHFLLLSLPLASSKLSEYNQGNPNYHPCHLQNLSASST